MQVMYIESIKVESMFYFKPITVCINFIFILQGRSHLPVKIQWQEAHTYNVLTLIGLRIASVI